MKRNQKLLILAGTLVVVSAAAFAATRLAAEPETTETETETVTVYSADAEAVTALSWTCGEETITLEKEGEEWVYPEDEAFPVNDETIEGLTEVLTEIQAERTLESPEDLSEYGLEDPQYTIEVSDGSDTTLKIGDETSLGGQYYLSTGDGNVYIVDSTLPDTFSLSLYDLVEEETIPEMTDVDSVTISRETDTLKLFYQEDSGFAYSDRYTWFLEDAEPLALDVENTETLVSQITGLSWLECVDYNAEDLSQYGLNSPTVTVTVTYTETETVTDEETSTEETQEISRTFTLLLGDYGDSGCYAKLADSNMVYLVDASILDSLLYVNYEDLQPMDVLQMDWDEMTAVDLILDGVTYHIEKTTQTETDEDGNETETTVFLLEDTELDSTVVDDMLSALNAMEPLEQKDGLTASEDGEIAFRFYQNSEDYPEVELSFGSYDSTSCTVTLMGQTRLLVAKEDVESVRNSAEMVLESLEEAEDSAEE